MVVYVVRDTNYLDMKQILESIYNSNSNDYNLIGLIDEGKLIRYDDKVYSVLCIDEEGNAYIIAESESDVEHLLGSISWKEYDSLDVNSDEMSTVLSYMVHGISEDLTEDDKDDVNDIYKMMFHVDSDYEISSLRGLDARVITVIYS